MYDDSKKVEVNGKIIWIKPSRSSFKKTANSIKNEIFAAFKRIGITEEFVDLPIPRNPLKRGEPAQISWIVNGKDYFFNCSTQERYVDNLGVIGKVIEQESYAIRNGLKQFGQVMNQFRLGWEGESVERVKSPREILGVDANIKDVDYITFKYKQLAKELHPDAETGDADKFKELREAYEALKKELS